MDIKTMQKVINGQEDKLQELDKKINDNKINCVSNNDYKKLWEENTKDYGARMVAMENNKGVKNYWKIEALIEDRVEFNINERITKLEELEASIKNIDENSDILFSDAVRKIFARMDSAEQTNYSHINGINDRLDDRVLKEDYDALEGKYYTLRSELDSIYKVLEMDALDIQDLYNKLENHPKKKNINLTEKEGCYDE